MLTSLPANQYDLLADPEQTLAEGRLLARAIADSAAGDVRRLALARGFCAMTVATYWSACGGTSALLQTSPDADLDTLSGASLILAKECA